MCLPRGKQTSYPTSLALLRLLVPERKIKRKSAGGQAGKQADKQTGRQADKQTGRQADRQTGRQADCRQGDKDVRMYMYGCMDSWIYMDLLICMHLPRRTAARGGRVTAARVSVSPAAHRRAGGPRARASLPRSLGQACPAPRPCSSPSLHTPGRGCRRLQGQSCYENSPQNQ